MVIQHSLKLLKELSEIETKISQCKKVAQSYELELDWDELLINSYLQSNSNAKD